MNKFGEMVMNRFEVGKKASIVRRLIEQLIHTQADYREFVNRMDNCASNKILDCLCEMRRARQLVV